MRHFDSDTLEFIAGVLTLIFFVLLISILGYEAIFETKLLHEVMSLLTNY